MDIVEIIKKRRSIRQYIDRPIKGEAIKKLLEASISAPSGKNGQPWKFSVVNDPDEINRIAKLSHYIKDVQSCGAAIQNILLAAHSMDIGSCWVGEFIEKGKEIKELLRIRNDDLEVMGVVTLGYSDKYSNTFERRELESFMVKGAPKTMERN